MDGITTAGRLLLKDAPADRLIDAVHAAARGEATFAPEVTMRLVETYIRARPCTAPPRQSSGTERRP
jgi:DNA-binding NarL/FixJ family response regulator